MAKRKTSRDAFTLPPHVARMLYPGAPPPLTGDAGAPLTPAEDTAGWFMGRHIIRFLVALEASLRTKPPEHAKVWQDTLDRARWALTEARTALARDSIRRPRRAGRPARGR